MCTTALFMGCSAPDLEQQVDELYGKMTQEERIAQLRSMYMEDLFDEQGQLDTEVCIWKISSTSRGSWILQNVVNRYPTVLGISPNMLFRSKENQIFCEIWWQLCKSG